MVIQQEQLSRTKQIRWQVDSLKLEYKMKEIQWD